MNVAGHHFLAHARLTGNEDFAATCAGAPGHLEDVPHGRAPADHTRRRDRLTCETGVHRLHATTESHEEAPKTLSADARNVVAAFLFRFHQRRRSRSDICSRAV